MATVSNTIVDPSGVDIESAKIKITLVWDKDLSAVIKDDAAQVLIAGAYSANTDSDGEWTVELEPNENLTPLGSLYRVSETVSPGDRKTVYYIDVPDGATPVYWVGDILASSPSY
jgi:hypothetical protein